MVHQATKFVFLSNSANFFQATSPVLHYVVDCFFAVDEGSDKSPEDWFVTDEQLDKGVVILGRFVSLIECSGRLVRKGNTSAACDLDVATRRNPF